MNHEPRKDHKPAKTARALELQRQALINRCALERVMVAAEIETMRMTLAPENLRASALSQLAQLKVPLAIAGVALGLLALRPKRAVRALATGASLWKVARGALAVLHGMPRRSAK
jgi:hypothetical protein